MLNSKTCETCSGIGELICFCRQVILCTNCVGAHIMSDISSNHKPVPLSESQLASLMAESWPELCATEAQILAQASQKQEVLSSIRLRLEKEMSGIEEFQNLSIQFITEIVNAIERDLLTTQEDLMYKVISQCGVIRKQISEALDTLKKGDYQYNELANALTSCSTCEEIEKFEILKKQIDFSELDIKSLVLDRFIFDISVKTSQNVNTPAPDPKQSKPSVPGIDIDAVNKISRMPTSLPKQQIMPATKLKEPIAVSPTKMVSPKTSPMSRSGNRFYTQSPFEIGEVGENYVSLTTRESNESEIQKSNSLIQKAPKSHMQRTSSKLRRKMISSMVYCFLPKEKQINAYNAATDELSTIRIKHRDVGLEGSAWTLTSEGLLVVTGGIQMTAKRTTWIFNVLTQELTIGPNMKFER